jgi:hypothetical protein
MVIVVPESFAERPATKKRSTQARLVRLPELVIRNAMRWRLGAADAPMHGYVALRALR